MSWTPSPKNTSEVGVAHIVLKPVADGTQTQLREAMLVLRDALAEAKLRAIPLFDGLHGAALFISLAAAPPYDAVRAWLHTFVDGAIAQHPKLLVHEKRPHDVRVAPRIECTLVANAVGHGSLLAYSLNGTSRLPMVTPISWDELDHINNGDATATHAMRSSARSSARSSLRKPARAERRRETSGRSDARFRRARFRARRCRLYERARSFRSCSSRRVTSGGCGPLSAPSDLFRPHKGGTLFRRAE